jgi:WD40 repeat protein
MPRQRPRLRAILRGHKGYILAVAFSPDGKLLATCSGGFRPSDSTVKLWDVDRALSRGSTEPITLKGHEGVIWCLAFSPDGKTLASGSMDKTVKLWDVGAWRAAGAGSRTKGWRWTPRTIRGDANARGVKSVVFSPDGKIVATGTYDGHITLWDAATQSRVSDFSQAPGEMRSIAFSPDGKRLATAKDDLKVRIWNPAIRQVVAILPGHTRLIEAVAFAPDGNTLASAGADGTVRLWRAAPVAETEAKPEDKQGAVK